MTCDVPVRECLWEHIRPHLGNAKTSSDGREIRARCPLCGGSRTFTIGKGDRGRITWNCYVLGCGDQTGLRDALLRAGVPRSCLPAQVKTRAAAADDALKAGTRSCRAEALVRAHLILLGYPNWPKGTELGTRAAEVGVSLRSAQKAKELWPRLLVGHPGTTSTNHTEQPPVKFSGFPQADELLRIVENTQPTAYTQPTAFSDTQPTAFSFYTRHGVIDC